jgi:general secretion pathway protein N
MSWLEKNPLGAVLVSICGFLLLVSAILVFIWGRPVSSGADSGQTPTPESGPAAELFSDLGPVSEYRIVTDRPVFDESRRPSVSVDEGDALEMDDLESAVAGAPEVMLTGVIISPDDRMAMLRPLSGGDSVIAREGELMEGEYVGWLVSDIEPRRVKLSSIDGESMELELLVNTRRIEEPPTPQPAGEAQSGASQAQSDTTARAQQAGDDGQPLSRAEEIRQRIAERREELRREQESRENAVISETRSSEYQNAMRDLIQGSRERRTSNDSGEDDDG